MKININLLKKLRNITNLGILECKEALNKCNNNINMSIEYLTKNNSKFKFDNNNKNLNNGCVYSKISLDNKYGVIIKISCNTDFVSKNKDFINFLYKILNFCISNKLNNFEYIKKIFNKDILYLTNKFKENICINDFFCINGNNIQNYNHINKYSVLINLDNDNIDINIVKKICMHIICNRPFYIYKNEIPNKILHKEIKLQKNNIENFNNKNDDSKNKILNKKINEFIEKITLEEQKFIMDTNIIIKDILIKNKILIKSFKMISI